MKKTLLLALMIAALGSGRLAWAQGAHGGEQVIRRLYADYDAAWNRGDVAGVAGVWADDAEHMEPDGRLVEGGAAIHREFVRRLSGDLKGTHSHQRVEQVRFVSADVAVVDASYTVTGAHGPDGKLLPPLRGRYVDIWVKKGGRWHVAADRPIVPAPAR